MTPEHFLSSNGKTPKIIKDRLKGVKSFVIPKKEKDFWKIFPFSKLSILNVSEEERTIIKETAQEYFNTYSNQLMDIFEGKVNATLKEIKKLFYYLQETSFIMLPRISYYDPVVSYIHASRVLDLYGYGEGEIKLIKVLSYRQLDMLEIIANSTVEKFTTL